MSIILVLYFVGRIFYVSASFKDLENPMIDLSKWPSEISAVINGVFLAICVVLISYSMFTINRCLKK